MQKKEVEIGGSRLVDLCYMKGANWIRVSDVIAYLEQNRERVLFFTMDQLILAFEEINQVPE